MAGKSEQDPRYGAYVATEEELQIIDAAIASIEAGEVATEAEIEAALAKFRSA
jgi:predicted transcriptional regulator